MGYKPAMFICDTCGVEERATYCYGDECLPDDWSYGKDSQGVFCEKHKAPPREPTEEEIAHQQMYSRLYARYVGGVVETLTQVSKARRILKDSK